MMTPIGAFFPPPLEVLSSLDEIEVVVGGAEVVEAGAEADSDGDDDVVCSAELGSNITEEVVAALGKQLVEWPDTTVHS